jgi:hypothetical protein
MFIERIACTGFAGLPDVAEGGVGPLGRFARQALRPRQARALGDAVQLCFAACDAAVFQDLLARWGCRGVTVRGDGPPEGAEWTHAPGSLAGGATGAAAGLGGVVDPAADGRLQVSVTLSLDPPQFRMLRANAARDPRLVDALADGANLTLRVGARFSTGWDAVDLDLLGLVVGGVPFPVAGAERPSWVGPLLRGLHGRVFRGHARPERWAQRAASWSAHDQRTLRRAARALGEAPFSLGDVVVLTDGPALLEASSVVALSNVGDVAVASAGLVGAVFLEGADVLLLESVPDDRIDWLAEQAEAEGSPLEQVIVLG